MFKKIKSQELRKIEENLRARLSKINNCPLTARRIHYLIKAELLRRELGKK